MIKSSDNIKARQKYIYDRLSEVKNISTEKRRIAKEFFLSWRTVHNDYITYLEENKVTM